MVILDSFQKKQKLLYISYLFKETLVNKTKHSILLKQF